MWNHLGCIIIIMESGIMIESFQMESPSIISRSNDALANASLEMQPTGESTRQLSIRTSNFRSHHINAAARTRLITKSARNSGQDYETESILSNSIESKSVCWALLIATFNLQSLQYKRFFWKKKTNSFDALRSVSGVFFELPVPSSAEWSGPEQPVSSFQNVFQFNSLGNLINFLSG